MFNRKLAEAKPGRQSATVQSFNTATTQGLDTTDMYTWGPDTSQRQAVCACGGGCPRCLGVQAKLQVNRPGDIYEQEADNVADALMRMPAPVIQRAPT